MGEESRKRSRTQASFEVTVQIGKEKATVHTRNISLSGICCSSNPLFHKQDSCRLKLALSPAVEVNMKGKILRSDTRGTAIAFTSMDEASFRHLKNLVAYNTGDADKIEDELRQAVFSPEKA